jgi:hypothetical protein
MYNLLIAIGIGALAFVAGVLATGTTIAGIIPAVLASGIAYFLLMRRTGKQLAAISEEAMAIFQGKMATARTQAEQKKVFAEGQTVLERGFALGRWQFLVSTQIHTQLGTLSYMQRDFKTARIHLEKGDSWLSRFTAWQPMSMLALLEYRDGEEAAAVKRLQGLKMAGGKDPLYWALTTVVANRAKQTKDALKAISDGLERLPDSGPLQKIADQLRNKRHLTPEIFGQGWLQFFPEEAHRVFQANPALQQQMMQAQAANGPTPPSQQMNRAQRRAAKRDKKKGKSTNNAKLNHPRY